METKSCELRWTLTVRKKRGRPKALSEEGARKLEDMGLLLAKA